jgi:hypothetical protein
MNYSGGVSDGLIAAVRCVGTVLYGLSQINSAAEARVI